MNNRDLQADVETITSAVIEALHILPWEYGGIGVDPKRPFGNSDVEGDMLELLRCKPAGDNGFEPCWSSEQKQYVHDIYHNRVIARIREVWSRRTQLDKAGGR